MNPFTGNSPSSNPEENHGLSPADAAWLARVFTKNGVRRSPAEIAQMKALLEAYCAASPAASAPASRPALPDESQIALLDITDDLGHLRALFIALDMALADIQDRDARSALRTLAATIHTHLRTIRNAVERLRNRSRDSADDEQPTRRE
ncbi:MAG: hypothetical protein HLUCCO17_12560 [Saliniramus fredricksonii]|uniref:Uncharacterized protein n=1 Tax=Saliniramus fredricksonii TaxID=1653334 RepID=A0A0P8A4C9_9HYPH|nr:hypothetical protein [Saliniramus fredricksonii]KPQ10103.1 MAG: hypothetical protein HLUCCO17_12560 [Saliniramus fredricksonii]SCC80631.1 hypothetical protein GA0071312_1605 [Saliniramus fredricksonii]